MNFSESFKQALDSLKANKLRSFLTMLGIIMGVFSVITIMAIGNAAQGYIDSQFEKVGANLITVKYKAKNVSSSEWLTLEDMEFVKKVAPEIKNIATYLQRSGTLRMGSKTRDAVVTGVSSQYKSFAPIEMATGRFINDIDNSTKQNVIIVDERFAKKYYKKVDIVGEVLPFRAGSGTSVNLKVVGVMKSEETVFDGMMDNEDFPVYAYMPVTTVQSIFGGTKRIENINVTILEKDQLKDIGDRLVNALEMRKGREDLYMAENSADQQKIFSNVMGVISSVLLVIAIITLVVGGIGIVNILLVSVTERIREIGIRKALGAQKKDIIIQFITESIIMTGFSGIIGIILGLLAGGVISAQIKIPPVVDIKVITMAFMGSVALGLIFGVYPAKKAADLDPIESLRYE